MTGFQKNRAACPVFRPVRDSVSCLSTLFCLPVWNKALKKACPEKSVLIKSSGKKNCVSACFLQAGFREQDSALRGEQELTVLSLVRASVQDQIYNQRFKFVHEIQVFKNFIPEWIESSRNDWVESDKSIKCSEQSWPNVFCDRYCTCRVLSR